jgi:hypothetical protein
MVLDLMEFKGLALFSESLANKGHHFFSALQLLKASLLQSHTKIGTQGLGPFPDCLFSKMNLMKDSLILSSLGYLVCHLYEVGVITIDSCMFSKFLADSDALGKCLAILSLGFHCDVILKGYCDF